MPTWNELRDNVGKTAKAAVEKTEEIAGDASLRVKILQLKAQQKDLYTEVGKLSYKRMKSGKDHHTTAINALLGKIDDLQTKIDEMNAVLREKRQKKKES